MIPRLILVPGTALLVPGVDQGESSEVRALRATLVDVLGEGIPTVVLGEGAAESLTLPGTHAVGIGGTGIALGASLEGGSLRCLSGPEYLAADIMPLPWNDSVLITALAHLGVDRIRVTTVAEASDGHAVPARPAPIPVLAGHSAGPNGRDDALPPAESDVPPAAGAPAAPAPLIAVLDLCADDRESSPVPCRPGSADVNDACRDALEHGWRDTLLALAPRVRQSGGTVDAAALLPGPATILADIAPAGVRYLLAVAP